MTSAELERWASRQIAALIDAGTNAIDAHNQVTRFLAKLPVGADPSTYVSRDTVSSEDLTSKAVLNDLRSAWYGSDSVEARFKRILDAKGKP
jgi:hypothetical protein